MKKAIKLLAKLPEQEKQARAERRADVQRFYTDPTPAELTRGTFRGRPSRS